MNDTSAAALISDWLDVSGRKPADLCRASGLSAAHLSLILSGKKGLSPESADRVAAVTGIDVRRLLGLTVPGEAA